MQYKRKTHFGIKHNYRTLHGRDVFGDRFHVFSWFTLNNEEWHGDERRILEKNAFHKAINQMMDWLPKILNQTKVETTETITITTMGNSSNHNTSR